MPQKKNPDALELLRGKAGRVFGHQMALLATLKGLPLAYNKDMQEDKEAVFDTVDTVRSRCGPPRSSSITLTVNEERTRDAATKGYLNATELADYLVKKGVPFRTAHETVGSAVLYAIGEGKELNELRSMQLQEFSPEIGDDVADRIEPRRDARVQRARSAERRRHGSPKHWPPQRISQKLNGQNRTY